MRDASERRKDAEGRAAELDDFTIAKNGSRKYAILVLRRKGGNQVEEFQIDAEHLRAVCSEFLETTSVEELRKIRDQLSGIGGHMPLSAEVAGQVVDLLDKVYVLPKREVE